MLDLNNKLILAPLAGYTDIDFRLICRRFGVDITFSEMISVKGVRYRQKKTISMAESDHKDTPYIIQLFGNEPDDFADAATHLTEKIQYISGFDVNCGCPVRKVLKQGAGVALMRDPDRIGRIVKALRGATKLAVSVKIRLGWDNKSINYIDVAKMAQDNGADYVILHARDKDQLFSGEIDYDAIAKLKKALTIPIVGNGNVCDLASYKRIKETGCDSVMIGRHAIGNPWIFEVLRKQSAGESFEPTRAERLAYFREHATAFMNRHGETEGLRKFRILGVHYMRNIIFHHRKKVLPLLFAIKTSADLDNYIQTLNDPEYQD